MRIIELTAELGPFCHQHFEKCQHLSKIVCEDITHVQNEVANHINKPDIKILIHYCRFYIGCVPVPVAARSKALVCGRSPAEIVGSNPTGSMDVCMFYVMCVLG